MDIKSKEKIQLGRLVTTLKNVEKLQENDSKISIYSFIIVNHFSAKLSHTFSIFSRITWFMYYQHVLCCVVNTPNQKLIAKT